MQHNHRIYPMFVVSDLPALRSFYLEKLGCRATIDFPNYLQVQLLGKDGPEISFISHQGAGGFGLDETPQSFSGKGVVMSIQVPDPDAYFETLRQRNVEVLQAPTNRPWQWRSFLVQDPGGLRLDFFATLEAK